MAATWLLSATPHLRTVPLLAAVGVTPERLGLSAGALEFLARKSAHAAAYALLGIGLRSAGLPPLGALGAAVLWAALDEMHQAGVPGRDGSVRDVVLDTAGAAMGVLLASRWRAWRRHAGRT